MPGLSQAIIKSFSSSIIVEEIDTDVSFLPCLLTHSSLFHPRKMEFGFELNPDDQVKQLQEQLASARAQAARSDMAARISLQRAEYAENERDGLINTLENAFGQICLYKRENGNVVLFECICLYSLFFFFIRFFIIVSSLFIVVFSVHYTACKQNPQHKTTNRNQKKKNYFLCSLFSCLCSLFSYHKQTNNRDIQPLKTHNRYVRDG